LETATSVSYMLEGN